MAVVYDFSGSPTNPAAGLTDLPGAAGAMLYMGTPGRHKNTTPQQVGLLIAKGYGIGGVFEDGLNDWAQGRAGGQRFARLFDADATRCGVPGLAGAFTADTPAANPLRFVEMLTGACDVLGVARVTAYGYMNHLVAARAAGVASRFWLTGHCPQPMPDWINLYQHNGSQPAEWGPTTTVEGGMEVDHNTICRSDWGQFGGAMAGEADLEVQNANRTRAAFHIGAGVGDMWVDTWTLAQQIKAQNTAHAVQLDAIGKVLSDDEANILAAVRAADLGDSQQIAEHLAPLLLAGGLVAHLSDDDAAKLATVVNNEVDRRAAARANTPVADK